ncbi:ABC transporter substrate-binding protein [Nocardiaceae bacterium NPDC056970]
MTVSVALAPTDHDREWAAIVDSLTRRGFLAGLGVSMAAVVAGCGTGSEASAGSGSAALVGVRDDYGDLDVPADPRRIVVVHVSAAATLLDLGVPAERIVGGFFGPAGVQGDAVLRSMPEAAGIPNIGTAGTWNLEAIVGTDPDLIVMLTNGGEYFTKTRNELASTGVPVFAGFNGYLTWEELERLVTTVGVGVRRESQAAALVDRTRRRRDDLRARLSAQASLPTVALLRAGDGGVVYTQVDPLLDALGFPGDRPTPDQFAIEIPAEKIDTVTSDVVIVSAFGDFDDARARMAANPLWERLPAVRAGRVHYVDDSLWGAGYSPRATQMRFDDIERIFT